MDLQVLPRFLRVFEKIEKVAFLLPLPFWWGEQDSNRLAKPLIYNVLCYFEKQGLDFASELQKTSNLMM